LILEYEDIVVGSSLKAVLFAFNKNLPIIFSEPQRPFRFDFFDPNTDLGCVKLTRSGELELTRTNGVKVVGSRAELLWERLMFLLNLDGKVPLANLCSSMRFDGEHLICSNEYSKIGTLNFSNCFYFGDDNISGLVKEKELANPTYTCYDWIAFNSGGKHEIDYIWVGDDFVKEIWFYSSDRMCGNSPVKDACIVSTLTQDQLSEFDYSETMARFKMISEMEKRGMKGRQNGYSTNGNPKHYKFRTTPIRRTKRRDPVEIASADDRVSLPRVSQKSLLKNLETSCAAYDRFLRYL
jgi:hypothetical protein